jgi:two-component system nitrate/nitrite response regulator NarL
MRQLTLLVGEDHPLMVDAIKLVLAESTEFEIVGTASSGADVIALAERTDPDLVLLDVELPDGDGIEVLRALQRLANPPQVVMFSAHEQSGLLDEAFRAGASAFINKRIDPWDLPAALRQAVDPTLFQPLKLNPLAGNGRPEAELTERELELLEALSDGLTNKGIAQRLGLSEQTVKFHLSSVYRKLGVSSRTEALAATYRRRADGSRPAAAPTATR